MKLFRRNILRIPEFEPTPDASEPCTLPLSQALLLLNKIISTLLQTQQKL